MGEGGTMTTFFSQQDLITIATLEDNLTEQQAPASLHNTWQHFQQIHEQVYAQLRMLNMDLHPMYPKHHAVRTTSVARPAGGGALCVGYLRTRAQMVSVERLMGREEIANLETVEAHRHPVIELRLTKDYFVLELLLSRDAWWDQENLMGKVSIARHRQDFFVLLRTFERHFRMGFWQGQHLSEMHLTAPYFYHTSIMTEWLSTFQPGSDWFRLGIWYPVDSEQLDSGQIVNEIMHQIRPLYDFYEFIRWTSDNSFRDFYAPMKASR
jgi:hypothetical protein